MALLLTAAAEIKTRGWMEHPGLVEDVPAYAGELEPYDLQGPFQPSSFYDSVILSPVYSSSSRYSKLGESCVLTICGCW